MIDISCFKSVNVQDEGQRTPLLCVTEATVAFGIGAIESLRRPKYARLVVDYDNRKLFLFGCDSLEDDAFEFVKKDSDRYVRLKSRALHILCDKLSGYKASDDVSYRVNGKIDALPNEAPVIVFDMKEAREISKKLT